MNRKEEELHRIVELTVSCCNAVKTDKTSV